MNNIQINNNKSKIQSEALEAWKNNNFIGTINLPTGSGKTRIIVVGAGSFIKSNPTEKWLIVVPKERLRDVEIPNEFKNWGFSKEFKQGITVECIQTACRRIGEEWDGLCVDEVHNTTSPEFKKLYENNKFKRKLFLSATIEDEDKKEYIFNIAPLVYYKSVKEALNLGLISDYRIYNLAVKFTKTEESEHNKIQNTYRIFENKLGGKFSSFKNATKFISKGYKASATEKQNASIFFNLIKKRKTLLFKAENKINVTLKLQDMFKDEYGLFFCESIDFAEEVCKRLNTKAVTYHSKMTDTQKEINMKKFIDNRTSVRLLCAAKALNEGFNVEKCSYAICGSGSSKQLDQIQRLGRIVRLQEGKVAKFINLYVPNTQEEKWVKSRTSNQTVEWIDSLNDIEI